jgi:signal peptidase I
MQWRTGGAVGLGLVSLLVLRLWIVEPTVVESTSMAPTIAPGSVIWLDKVSPGVTGVRNGDLVTFRGPEDGALMVKRVVAVAGQEVSMQDGVLNVDGLAVNEPFIDQESIDGVYFGLVQVGEGELFVMGDNRGASIDSRRFGPIPASTVEARVIGIR